MSKIILILLILYSSFAESSMARINLAVLPESKDPLNNHNFNQFLVIDCIYNTLINLGENGELESEIAKEWKFQNSHKQLELTLKRDATFQDHVPSGKQLARE